MTLSNLTVTYTGSAQSPTVTTAPAGLSYNLAGAPQTKPGSYTVTATITNPNYTGSAGGNFVIQDFTIAASPAFQTISSGQKATYTLTLTSLDDLSGSISLGWQRWAAEIHLHCLAQHGEPGRDGEGYSDSIYASEPQSRHVDADVHGHLQQRAQAHRHREPDGEVSLFNDRGGPKARPGHCP